MRIGIILLALFLSSCKDLGDNNTPANTEQKETSEYKKFAEEFTAKFPGSFSLPKEQIFQMIKAVPDQNTSWGCGKVQGHMAIVSASIAAERLIDEKQAQECNVVKDYPLAVNLNRKYLGGLEDNLIKDGVKFEKDPDGQEFFRVGAVPEK